MVIHPLDNVEVNLTDGHKYALYDVPSGNTIIKYGNPIGHAVCNIRKGEHVHSHNMKTNLSGNLTYTYSPEYSPTTYIHSPLTFMGYARKNGDVGIRNEIWIINTVGCVNKVAKKLYPERELTIIDPAPAVAKHTLEVMIKDSLITENGYGMELHASGDDRNLINLYNTLT